MRISVFSVFAASPKEKLGEVFGALRAGFEAAGLGQPEIRFIIMEAGPTPAWFKPEAAG